MTTFHAFLGCSVDGYIAGANGEMDWLHAFDEPLGDTGFADFFGSIDVMVMGRATFETMRDSAPDFYNGVPVHVLSRTLSGGVHHGLGQSRVTVFPDISAVLSEIDTSRANRVYVDGGKTVQAFLNAGLLSELVITRVPVILGKGIPLFGATDSPIHLEVQDSRLLSAGAVQTTYVSPSKPTPAP